MRSWALAFALAGCAQVFDLETPTLDDNTSPQTVTGRFYAKYPHNNSLRQTVIDDLVFPFTQAELRFADGVRMPIAVASDGSVEFQRAGREPYSVRFVTEKYPPIELQHDASHFELVRYRNLRPDGVPAVTGTQLTYQITDTTTPPPVAFAYSTGQWMNGQLSMVTANTFTFDWSNAYAVTDPPMIVQASAYDRLYLSLMVNFGAFGALIVDRYRADDIQMKNGMPNMITGPSTLVTRGRCMHLDLPFAQETARQNAAGFTDPVGAGGWYVQSFPSVATPVFNAPMIAYGAMSPPPDMQLDVPYGDPFGGVPGLQMSIIRSHALALPGGGSRDVGIGTLYLVEGQVSCTTPVKVVADVAIAMEATLGGVPLDRDGKSFTIDRSRPLELTWQNRGNGRSDRTRVLLMRVDSGLTVIEFVTTSDTIRVDPELLDANTTYVFQLDEETGFPNAATGNLNFSLPWGSSVTYSSTFVVTN